MQDVRKMHRKTTEVRKIHYEEFKRICVIYRKRKKKQRR